MWYFVAFHFAIAISFIFTGISFYIDEKNKYKNCIIPCNAIVDDNINTLRENFSKHDNKDSNKYYQILEYQVNGKKYKKQLIQDEKCLEIGDKVNILYDPNNPESFIFENETIDKVYLIFIGIGIFVLIISILYVYSLY